MICPHCGYKIPRLIRTCKKLVARNRSLEIKRQGKKINNIQKIRLESFNQVVDAVIAMPAGEEFSPQKLIRKLGWFGNTSGDLMRILLDWLTCLGMIEKTAFNFGMVGHTYKKLAEIKRCPMFIDNGKFSECKFSFKTEDGALLIEHNEREVE